MFNRSNVIFLTCIFLLAIFVRFINFHESVYFGYDEARDAYTSQSIYKNLDLKLSGAPASALMGVNHGPAYLYFVGPFYLVGNGDPYFVSAVFRIVSSLGVFILYFLGSLLAGPVLGLIAAFLYAISYEQYIYAIYAGNPSLSTLFWPIIFLGATLVYKVKEKRLLGLFLMIFASSWVTQFDLIHAYSFATLAIILFLLRKKLKDVPLKSWAITILAGLIPVYTYLLAELKNNFLGTKTLFSVVTGTQSILSEGENKYIIFWKNFVGLFSDNVLDFGLPLSLLSFLFIGLLVYVFRRARKNFPFYFILVWIGSMCFLLAAKGFMPYYAYAGLGVGVIVAGSILIYDIFGQNKCLAIILLGLVSLSNLLLINEQSKKSLIVEIKAQPDMRLVDEIEIVKKTYEYANGEGFTIRTTTMPYKIQTVWAYLYHQYGQSQYGYLPYLEGGNVEGYDGKLPPPIQGTTCIRFYIREPIRGIPENLLMSDIQEENLFSDVVKEEHIGSFLFQTRKAKALDCHTTK